MTDSVLPEFRGFPKIPRLSRDMVITEKLDGTCGVVFVGEDGLVLAGSKSRWITPAMDNHGFAKWVQAHEQELREGLGPGTHFGEWWGQGINRGYDLREKRFSLFNVSKWETTRPACCYCVPVLYRGSFKTSDAHAVLLGLSATGSQAAPGFMRPEGIVIFHVAGNLLFKKTILNDESPKTGVET